MTATIMMVIMAVIIFFIAGFSKKEVIKISGAALAAIIFTGTFLVPESSRGFLSLYLLLAVGTAGYILSAFFPKIFRRKRDWVRFAIMAISILTMTFSLFVLFG